MKPHTLLLLSLFCVFESNAFDYNTPKAGNPIIPGYFADPTVKKIGDTYYIYSTTDGNGGGKGPSQVWSSKDFVNWTLMPMNWPNTLFYWAPDVLERNGKYYLYYCQPCQIYCGESETPRGPWKNILNEDESVLIPDRFVTNAITLDGQTFVDDNDSVYLYFGTWGIYPGFGCGVVKLDENLNVTDDKRLIVNTEAEEFFEAPFIIKRNGIYYFTYSAGSCHDETYRVKYATSTVSPMGPFVTAENNPILTTNADKTVHGPGHHSFLQEDENYYIVYHRHNIPNSTRGMHRQIAVDPIYFSDDNKILPVEPKHNGIGYLAESTNPFENLAYNKNVKASSYYNDDFRPEYVVDDNNATLWRPKTCGKEWLEIDLGSAQNVKRIWCEFEYPTVFYQYKLLTSMDGNNWDIFSDRSGNLLMGSPMVDFGDRYARFIRFEFEGSEKNGISAALWNIKVFGDSKIDPSQRWIYLPSVAIEEDKINNNMGMLAGDFKLLKGKLQTETINNITGYIIPANDALVSSFDYPNTLNADGFTLSMKIYSNNENILKTLENNGLKISPKTKKIFNSIDNQWHNLVLRSDKNKIELFIDNNKISDLRNSKCFDINNKIGIRSTSKDLLITDVRVYNWQQHIAEANFDLSQTLKYLPKAAEQATGMLSKIEASDYNAGTSINRINNKGINGYFYSSKEIPVVLKNKRIAFEFDGSQQLTSNFGLPKTMEGNAPYTIAGWILNPEINDLEYIFDLNEANGESEKIIFGYGKNSSSGIVSHYAQYEDMGYDSISVDNEWKHLVVTFDGYMQRIYLNGELVKEKDIVLRFAPSDKLFLGSSHRGENPFSGWISSLELYDQPFDYNQIKDLYNKEANCNILFEFTPVDYTNNDRYIDNQGKSGGQFFINEKSEINEIKTGNDVRLALKGSFEYKGDNIDDIKLLIIETIGQKSDYTLINSDNLNVSASENFIFIKSNDIEQKIKLLQPLETNQWNLVAISENSLFVDSIEYKIENINLKIEDGFCFGNSKTKGLGRVGVYSEFKNKDQISELYNNMLNSNMNDCFSDISVNARNPYSVRISVKNNPELKYSYSNLSNKNSFGWTDNNNYIEENLKAGSKYQYEIKAKNRSGYIMTYPKKIIDLSIKNFDIYSDDFNSVEINDIWDNISDCDSINVMISNNNQLEISSSNKNFTFDGNDIAPALLKNIDGDFLAQVEIKDFSGLNERKPVNYNECGLVITSGEPGSDEYFVIQWGTFPYWNIGNMLTILTKYGRPQYFNKKGWDLNRYIQIERCGDNFHFRSGEDGVSWEELAQSPIKMEDLNNKSVKIGLYQLTGTKEKGYGTFDDFIIWKRK